MGQCGDFQVLDDHTVRYRTLTLIVVSPAAPTIAPDAFMQLTATGVYDDGTQTNLTSLVMWQSTNDAVVGVSNGSGGGVASGVAPGSATVSAAYGDVAGSSPIAVSGGETGKTVITSFPIPTQPKVIQQDQVSCYTVSLPSFASNVRAWIGNKTPFVGAFDDYTINAAWNTFDPSAPNRVTGDGVSAPILVPGNGFSEAFPATGVPPGDQRKLVLSVSAEQNASLASCPQMHHGWQINGTQTVSPLGNPSEESVCSLYWILVGYDVPDGTTVYLMVAGTSIEAGATNGSDAQIRATGYESSALYQIGVEQNLAVAIFAQPGNKLENWSDQANGGYNSLWEFVTPQVPGARCSVPGGTNDLPDGAQAMEDRLTAIVAHLSELGAASWTTNTLQPASVYQQYNAVRLEDNVFRLSNTLNFSAMFDDSPDVADVNKAMLNPWIPNEMDPSKTFDGTHDNDVGQENTKLALLGAWDPPALVHGLFPTNATPNGTADGYNKECGIQVQSYLAGQLVAVRWWKQPGETGTHTVKVWHLSGELLASKDASGETSSGWQITYLDDPINYDVEDIIVVSVNFQSKFADNLAPPYTLQIYHGEIRALAGWSRFGPPGQFPPLLPGDGETFFVDVLFNGIQ